MQPSAGSGNSHEFGLRVYKTASKRQLIGNPKRSFCNSLPNSAKSRLFPLLVSCRYKTPSTGLLTAICRRPRQQSGALLGQLGRKRYPISGSTGIGQAECVKSTGSTAPPVRRVACVVLRLADDPLPIPNGLFSIHNPHRLRRREEQSKISDLQAACSMRLDHVIFTLMASLKNVRHEKFAQCVASGLSGPTHIVRRLNIRASRQMAMRSTG